MPYPETSLRSLLQRFVADYVLVFRKNPSDSDHILVNSVHSDGQSEQIGNIYLENNGSETLYYSTGKDGDELFPASADFNSVEVRFERYAKLLMTEREFKNVNEQSEKNNLTNTNLNQMKNSNQNQAKEKKENQLIFVEYQKPTKDGHLITATDSYHNSIGKIHRSYNEASKKYEYVAYDHAGKAISEKNEKLWEVKNLFAKNSKQLLEDAHQRRIESKQNAKMIADEKEKPVQQLKKEDEPKKELENPKQDKTEKEQQAVAAPKEADERIKEDDDTPDFDDAEDDWEDRETELRSIREDESDREDRGLER